MYKNLANILKLFCLIGLTTFLLSCGEPTEPPPKPEPVSKKIVIKKEVPSKTKEKKSQPTKETTKPITPKTSETLKKTGIEAEKKAIEETPPAVKKDEPEKKATEETLQAAKKDEPLVLDDRYNPIGKINPFVPLFKEEAPVIKFERKKEKKRKILTPLEKYDLDQLKLTGIIRSSGGNRALVEESSGRGYVVTVGTYIGIHSGKVSEILTDRIIIDEEGENAFGKISILKKELVLQKPPGEE